MSAVSTSSETAIWARVIQAGNSPMSPDAARYFLSLGFGQADLTQMHELAVRNQQGELSPEEVETLRNFRQIGLQLDLLRSQARLVLNATDNKPR